MSHKAADAQRRRWNQQERNELAKDVLEKAAEEALTRPPDSAWWDKRCFNTHGLTFEWFNQVHNLVDESNFYVALELIREAAGPRAEEHVVDGEASHWAYGSVRYIFVQVYTKKGEFTAAFKEAVRLALATRNDEILDEGDYQERENRFHEEEIDRALEHVRSQYPDDNEQDEAGVYEQFSFDDLQTYPEVEWDWMGSTYKEARNAYFEKRAREFLPYDAPYIHENQLVLFDD